MSDRDPDKPADAAQPQSFARRWSQRKLQQQHAQEQTEPRTPAAPEHNAAKPAAHEAQLPSVDEINEDSEVGMFFGEGVSETLRRQALRKLFRSSKFNVIDGLDDYAEDYNAFQPLGKVMTAHQRLREERERLAALRQDDESADRALEPGEADEQQQTSGSQADFAAHAEQAPDGSDGLEEAAADEETQQKG